MSTGRSPDELFTKLERGIAHWSDDERESHGFALLDDDRHRDRMFQGRRVLVAEHLLSTWVSTAAPVVLMKGLEVAQLYPDPAKRPFRDLDLLVRDPRPRWDALVAAGFVQKADRRIDIDHHHLPSLSDPSATLGVEVHHRPNVPGWAQVPTELLFDTAEPSRTGLDGVMRPRDDLHALLIALHGWKGGFTRLRDLFDAVLLASVSAHDVRTTARELGLTRLWRRTIELVDTALLGEPSTRGRALVRMLVPRHSNAGLQRDLRRVLVPYLVASPVRVTATHVADVRLGRAARRKPVTPDG